MKKLSLIIFALLLIFVSCEQSPIFYHISQEIKLDDPTIGGKVYAIKKLGDTLYAANELLSYKSMSDSRWTKMSTSFKVTNIAVDSDNLYALGNPSDDTFSVYLYTTEKKWEKITDGVSSLFDDNAGNAYFVKDVTTGTGDDASTKATVYKLAGISYTAVPDANGKAKSAVNLGGTTYFLENTASAASASHIYISDGKTVKYGTVSSWENTSVADSSITSMYIFGNQLYVGTESGVFVATINGDGSLSSFTTLPSNAESAFGDREVLGVWKFDDKDNFFVSVTSTTASIYDALWGFNSDSGKWNLE
ncbi:MAG: hypothetical protein IJX32_02390 [Spirochaetaceae bacterium]|nr:hypothetical protein [Spirochaetaceae bacterium]